MLNSKIKNAIVKQLHFLFYIARWTLPERKHLVHTWIVVGVPLTTALIFFRFGAHFLFVCIVEWLIWLPDITPLLHISHLLDIKKHLLKIVKYRLSNLLNSNNVIISENSVIWQENYKIITKVKQKLYIILEYI